MYVYMTVYFEDYDTRESSSADYSFYSEIQIDHELI
jgi:hypothetical protein